MLLTIGLVGPGKGMTTKVDIPFTEGFSAKFGGHILS